MLREMSSSYGKSAFGYLWAVLEPLGGIIILAIGFSFLLSVPPMGNSFLLFYATGFLPFTVYQDIQLTVSRSIRFNKPLLVYPAVRWIDAMIARFMLNFLTSVMISTLLVGGILLFTDAEASLKPGPLIASISFGALIGAGIGSINATLFDMIPSWEMVWSIATRPLFIASGVFFAFDTMPEAARNVLWWNPLIHVIGLMRAGTYSTYSSDYISITYLVFVSLITLSIGIIIMGRYHRDILNN